MDPITIVMLAVLALLIFFMFRNSRKRQRDVAAMADRTQPGAKVMTNFGLFGTIVAIDEEENQVQLETGPGTILTVHRQTIAKIITPNEVVSDDDAEAVEAGDVDPGDTATPHYGERVVEEAGDTTSAARSPKKLDE
jgi:preprotein translocase subunit YajC